MKRSLLALVVSRIKRRALAGNEKAKPKHSNKPGVAPVKPRLLATVKQSRGLKPRRLSGKRYERRRAFHDWKNNQSHYAKATLHSRAVKSAQEKQKSISLQNQRLRAKIEITRVND